MSTYHLSRTGRLIAALRGAWYWLDEVADDIRGSFRAAASYFRTQRYLRGGWRNPDNYREF